MRPILVVIAAVFAVLPARAVNAESFSQQDKEEFEKGARCKPLRDALEKAAQRQGNAPPDDVAGFIRGLKKPGKVSEEDWSYCQDLFRRALTSFRAKSIETEARVSLKSMMVAAQSAYADGGLCPSAGPTPARLDDVREHAVTLKDADWKAWECTFFSLHGEKQRFQYQMTTDEKRQTVELTARGFPSGPDAPVTFRVKGKVKAGELVFGEIEREEAPAKKAAHGDDEEELNQPPPKGGSGGYGKGTLAGVGTGAGIGGFCGGCCTGVCGCIVAQCSAQLLSALAYFGLYICASAYTVGSSR